MRPVILLSDINESKMLQKCFADLSLSFDAIYEYSERGSILNDYPDALVMFKHANGNPDHIFSLKSIFNGTDVHLITLVDESDRHLFPVFKDEPFAYLNFPPSGRELELLIQYYKLMPLRNDAVAGAQPGKQGQSNNDQFHLRDMNMGGQILFADSDQYQKVFESMSMVAAQGYNNKREIIFWNKASEILYGYSREEALGRKLEDLIIPDEIKDTVLESISGYTEKNIHIPSSELKLKKKDGSSVHIFCSHIMFVNNMGEKEFYSVDLDLTQIKRHQLIHEVLSEIATLTNESDDLYDFLQSLKDSMSRLINTRNFFVALYNEEDNSLSLPIFIDDVDQFRTFPAGRTLTAYMISMNKPLLLKEEEMAALEDQDIIDRVGSPCKIWLGVPLRRGERVTGAIVLQSYTDDTFYDETDMRTLQIVAEQISIAIERKTRLEQLRESERAMKTLISNLPGIAYRCNFDRSWTMEFLSDGFSILTGYQAEDFISNKEFSYSDIIHPDDREEVWNQVNKAIEENQPYYLVYRIISSGGVVKWVWEKGRAVSGEKNHIIALEGFIIDITDRIEMEEQVILAKEKAEESDRLKSAFLANLSHEIRSPMNSIVGFSQLLRSENVGEPSLQYTEIIFQSSRKLLNVINDIVDMAKIDSGQMLIKIKEFNPGELLNSMKNYAEEQLQLYSGKGIKIEVTDVMSFNNKTITSDEILIRKVLMHFINNAVKFTDRGKVEIGYEHNGQGSVRFYVKDTGIGISPEDHELVFERFRQVDERVARNFDGTGLGLSISKGIAGLLGGDILVESAEGEGAAFYFTIPVK